MKRSFLLLCTVLLVLGCALPCAAYRLARMALVVQGTAPSAAEAASVTSEESSREIGRASCRERVSSPV